MFRRFSVNFALFSMGVDALLIGLTLLLSVYIRPLLSDLPFAAEINAPLQVPLLLYPLFSIAWVAILLLLSVYDGRRNLRVTDELAALTLGSVLACVSLAGTLYLSFREISRILFILFVILAYLALVSWRLIARLIFQLIKENTLSFRHVLIVGAGPVGRRLQEQVNLNPWLGLSVTGFLDDDRNKSATNPEILGSLAEARQVINRYPVTDVVIALPPRAYQKVSALAADLHDLPVKVLVIPDYFHLALHKAVVEEFAGLPMLDLRAPALNEYQRMIKRAFDLLVGTLLLIPTLPLMFLVAVTIKLDSPGPVIYKQRRVGENGRLFWMYKFRSMDVNADERLKEVVKYDMEGHLIHKHPDDPRVTRVGYWLRKTSLDELPQFFNILKGEMSLVGPRPELPLLVQQYEPWQRKRFAVPQGVTGWWQINGRSEKPMHLHTEDDLYYVQNYSILLDIYILFKTVWVVLRRKGAF
jgi:exopolysaccharide biosynthesis polyprenyl glycosylphosphotransferase